MTNEPHPDTAQLDEFIGDLVQLRVNCGSPSLRDLVTSSEQVTAQYKQDHPKLQTLSVTALSDHLCRRRKQLPAWGWVATYVLACQSYARSSGARLDDPGLATLPGWHDRYRTARAGSSPPPATPPVQAPLSAPVELAPATVAANDPPRDRSGTWAAGSDWPPNDRVAPDYPALDANAASYGPFDDGNPLDDAELRHWLESLPPAEPLAMARYRRMFGRHGVDLLLAAENGNLDAACRLGILLLCERLPAEASAWLRSAAEGGDIVAEVLVNAEPDMRREMAAELAYELTLPGYDRDPDYAPMATSHSPTGAETYYRSASHTGHPGATHHLALMFQARGDDATAAELFARAAELGRPWARAHIELHGERADG